MNPEVICTQVVTTGREVNIIMAAFLCWLACGAVFAYLHPGAAHWLALRIAAHAEYVRACRKAGMQAKQEFLKDNNGESK